MISRRRARLAALLLIVAACQPPSGTGVVAGPRDEPRPPEAEEADAAPAAGGAALLPADLSGVPELAASLSTDRASLLEAVDRSVAWFEKPSSRESFPRAGVSYERARLSVQAFRTLIVEVVDPGRLAREIEREFELLLGAGRDGRGTVEFTGYYAPAFSGSRVPTEEFRYPLYRLPDDLGVDPETGETLGQRLGGEIVPYPTRADIEKSGLLAGYELLWLQDRFEAYLVHVQGSAAIELPNGSVAHIGYAGNNGHDYVSVARQLVSDGKLAEDELSLEEVRAHFEAHPENLGPYLHRNPRFVFFREDYGDNWPAGSLGVKVTPLRSLATDKELFPPGGVVLVVTHTTDANGRQHPFVQFMLDQDSGGAIRTPGRADIYFGVGRRAEARAGNQYAEGRLYYLFIRAERLNRWRQRLGF